MKYANFTIKYILAMVAKINTLKNKMRLNTLTRLYLHMEMWKNINFAELNLKNK
jgi:hypothetical protein